MKKNLFLELERCTYALDKQHHLLLQPSYCSNCRDYKLCRFDVIKVNSLTLYSNIFRLMNKLVNLSKLPIETSLKFAYCVIGWFENGAVSCIVTMVKTCDKLRQLSFKHLPKILTISE